MNKWVDSLHPINMPKQLWFHIGMHRVQDKIHPLSSGQFVSRNKIGISRKQDYFVNKTLKGQRGYNLTGIENKNWYPSEATEPVLIVP